MLQIVTKLINSYFSVLEKCRKSIRFELYSEFTTSYNNITNLLRIKKLIKITYIRVDFEDDITFFFYGVLNFRLPAELKAAKNEL